MMTNTGTPSHPGSELCANKVLLVPRSKADLLHAVMLSRASTVTISSGFCHCRLPLTVATSCDRQRVYSASKCRVFHTFRSVPSTLQSYDSYGFRKWIAEEHGTTFLSLIRTSWRHVGTWKYIGNCCSQCDLKMGQQVPPKRLYLSAKIQAVTSPHTVTRQSLPWEYEPHSIL